MRGRAAVIEPALVLAAALLFLWTASLFKFTVDDAYISMRYARHLVEGIGIVYNPGENVEGYTNFLWVIVLAAAYGLGFNVVGAAAGLGLACGVASMVSTWRAARLLWPDAWWGARVLPLFFLSTHWLFAAWATGGLETSLFTALVTVSIWVASRDLLANGPSVLLPTVAALVVLTRPDGLLFAGVLFLAVASRAWRTGHLRRALVRWTICFALPIVGHEAWRWFYYGDWLPNSFYAKVNRVQYVSRGLRFAEAFARDAMAWGWGVVASLGIVLQPWPILAAIGVYAAGFVSYTILIGGDWMNYRYYHHLLPLAALACVPVIDAARGLSLDRMPSDAGRPLRRIAATATAVLAVGIAGTAVRTYAEGPDLAFSFSELLSFKQLNLPEVNAIESARALEVMLEGRQAAAASFAGFTAAYSDRIVIDTLGLNDRYVARLPAEQHGVPGHEKHAPPDYLVSRGVLLVNPWPRTDPGDIHTAFSVTYRPGWFLHFGAVIPANALISILRAKGLDVWVGGLPVFDPARLRTSATILDADFERADWGGWQLTGEAFGASRRDGVRASNAFRISGASGKGYVNSFAANGDVATGTATSRPFPITAETIHFLVAGGASPKTAIELWVDGRRVRTTSGRESEELLRRAWDVREFIGRDAVLLIRDDESGPWGHVVVDDVQMGR